VSRQFLRTLPAADKVLLGGSAIVLVSLFLPWWDDGLGVTADGFHDWGWLTVFSLLLVVALYTVRRVDSVRARLPEMSVDDAKVYMLGGGVELLGAVAFWLGNTAHLTGKVRYGVLVCVVGSALTAAGGYAKLGD
jgi:hypothetical protein